jgi:hypothetical protein
MGHFHEYLMFFVSHLTVIIESIFALILAMAVFWLLANLKDENKDKSAGDIKDIESALRRVLATTSPPRETAAQAAKLIHDDDDDDDEIEKALKDDGLDNISLENELLAKPIAVSRPQIIALASSPATPPVAVTPAAGAPSPVVTSVPAPSLVTPSVSSQSNFSDAEIEKLKTELATKVRSIAEVQSALDAARLELEIAKKSQANSPSEANSAVALESQSKIKELEARLAEYEIIEDDIANLSIYKEENSRLKTEIEQLKSNKRAVPVSVTSAPSGVTALTVAAPEAVTQAATPMAAPTEPVAAQTSPAGEIGAAAPAAEAGQQLMDEFEKFMKGSGE